MVMYVDAAIHFKHGGVKLPKLSEPARPEKAASGRPA
jgi:hypothetical protein